MRGDDRTNLTPSAVAAVSLHLLVLVSGLIAWPWLGKPVQIANVTAITLTPSKQAPPPPALRADDNQTAAAPEPTPKLAPPAPPQPTPQLPAPTPPKAAPAKPQPAPVKPTPTPSKIDPRAIPKPAPSKAQAKTKPDDSDFLSSIANPDKSAAKTSSKPSAATKGPPRAETAPVARIDPGAEQATKNAADAVGGRLNRIWNKSCGVEGFRDLVIPVKFNLTVDGALLGAPQVLGPVQPGNPVWQAAADRAVRAVVQAAPFAELPRATYGEWKTFTAIFDGKVACQNQ